MWEAGADNFLPITNYIVEYQTSFRKNQWEELRQTGTNIPELIAVRLSPWVNYQFRVKAVNSMGESAPSASQGVNCATPPRIPDRHPSDVSFKEDEEGKLIIRWEVCSIFKERWTIFGWIAKQNPVYEMPVCVRPSISMCQQFGLAVVCRSIVEILFMINLSYFTCW